MPDNRDTASRPPRRLSDTANSLYAETLEQLLAEEAAGLDRHLRGSFKRRELSGRGYWYYQYRDLDQRVRQLYCGPIGGAWDRIARNEERGNDSGALDRKAQAGMLRAAGFANTPPDAFRLLAALGDAGLFKTGAVLVGTYAFMALGNHLGVTWPGRASATQDIDGAHGRSVELAVPGAGMSIPDVLEGLELGYQPIPKLDPKQPSTSFMFRNRTLRLDLLTPPHGKRTDPIHIPALGAPAQVLRFLDYLLETPQPAVLTGSRVLRVTVPDAARFAIHKLLVAAERPSMERAKARKDIDQAAQLLRVLTDERPGDIAPAWRAARKRGKNWERRLTQARAELPADVQSALAELEVERDTQ
jgi:hypothetical protein